jgi:hypothetical protein
MPEANRIVVVPGKLTEQVRNTLKAVLSLEGSMMQAYFAAKAKAAEELARCIKCPGHPRSVPQPLLYCPDRYLACSHGSSLEVRDGDTLHAHFSLLPSGRR